MHTYSTILYVLENRFIVSHSFWFLVLPFYLHSVPLSTSLDGKLCIAFIASFQFAVPRTRSQSQFCLNFVRCETIPWLPLCCCCCNCCCWCRQAETFGDRESCQQLPQKRQAGSKETNRKTCNWPDLLREREKRGWTGTERGGWGWAAARTWARTPGKLTHLDYKHNCHTCLHKCWQDCLISFN